MKKLTSTIALLSITGLIFSGCGLMPASQTDDSKSKETSESRNEQFSRDNRNMSRADIIGEVTSISGNNVSLKLIEQPQFNRNFSQNDTRGERRGKNRQFNESTQNSPQGEQRSESPNPDRTDFQRPEVKYTGEIKELTIPDNIEISTMGMGRRTQDQAPSAAPTLNLSDVKIGSTMQIWFSDQEKEIISRVTVRQPRENTVEQ